MNSRTSLVASLALVLALAPAARADDASIALDRFQLDPGANAILGLSSARLPERLQWGASLGIDWANRLLRLEQNGSTTDLVTNSWTAHLGGTVALDGKYEVSAALPVVLSRQGPGGAALLGDAASGVGDLWISPKLVLPTVGRYRLAASLPVTLPTAKGNSLLGWGSVTATPTGIIETDLADARIAGNLGIAFRPRRTIFDLTVGSAVTWGVGGELPFRAGGQSWAGLGSIWGELGLADGGSQAKPTELDLAVRWNGPAGLAATLGAGTALVNGYGAPGARVFGLLAWSPAAAAPPPPAPAPEPQKVEAPPAPPPAVAAAPPPPPVVPAPAPAPPPVIVPPPAPPAAPAPAPEPPKVVLTEKKIEINQSVFFDTGKDTIQARSFPLLDAVAKVLADNPQVKRVSVEGHTDSSGDAAKNQKLSERRAAAVRAYLVKKGIAASRLEAHGFGSSRPIAPNATAEGKAKNRRVEFLVK